MGSQKMDHNPYELPILIKNLSIENHDSHAQSAHALYYQCNKMYRILSQKNDFSHVLLERLKQAIIQVTSKGILIAFHILIRKAISWEFNI